MLLVTCAVIFNKNKVLCAQRSEKMRHPLKWEFPGGKLEQNESLEECVVREIREELNLNINVLKGLSFLQYDYTNGLTIALYPFVCQIKFGNITLLEHKQIKWLSLPNLLQLDWVEADRAILGEVMNCKGIF